MNLQVLLENMLEASGATLGIFFLTLLFSLPLGLLLAFGRMSKLKVVNIPVKIYILVMRGTPLMLQLMFVFYALNPLIGIQLPRFESAVVAFTLNYAAYFAEIYRGGIESMPVGQHEAGKVLGFTKAQTFIHVILPQVVKRILPPMGNEFITLVKDTSLAFTLSVAEMFSIAKALAASQTNMIPFVAAGLFYYIFNLVVAVGMEWVEKRMDYYR